jgi:hypothetical protein
MATDTKSHGQGPSIASVEIATHRHPKENNKVQSVDDLGALRQKGRFVDVSWRMTMTMMMAVRQDRGMNVVGRKAHRFLIIKSHYACCFGQQVLMQ